MEQRRHRASTLFWSAGLGAVLGGAVLWAGGEPVRSLFHGGTPVHAAAQGESSLDRAAVAAGLQRVLELEASRIAGRVSVHVVLENGAEAGIEPDRPVPAASVIKVPIMAALYDAWSKHEIPRTASDQAHLRRMITRSSNTSTNVLLHRVGMGRVNAWLRANGYPETCVRAFILRDEPEGPNLITAREMTGLLRQIVHGEAVDSNCSAEMRKLLLAQHWRERIPAGLPPGVKAGNKTGTMSDLIHDVAFVEAPSGLRYYVAILVERPDRSWVKSEELAQLSRSIYDYLDQACVARAGIGVDVASAD